MKEPREPRFGELRATLDYYRSGAPLLRYWWVVVVGAVAAVCVFLLVVQVKNDPYQYTASSQILVTSPEAPYFRFSITKEGTQQTAGGSTEIVTDTGPPDTSTLVQAANLYPLLIASDLVAAERIEQFGATPGTVEAKAVFAVQSASRFNASSVPVIELNATSRTPEDAVKLADDTAAAFGTWITKQQQDGGVKEAQRILVEPISAARVVSQTGGPSYAIPILLGAAVLLAFCGLAVLLDSMSRRGRTILDGQADAPQPVPLSQASGDDEALRRKIEGSGSSA
jgi:capsular polysaccharide biosynthesis protein